MNQYVPDFGVPDDYSVRQTSASLKSSSTMQPQHIVELKWQNGHVVMQNQNQNQNQNQTSLRRSDDSGIATGQLNGSRDFRSEDETVNHLFMQEDEMSSWLHYPLDETSFDSDITDLLYSSQPATLTAPPSTTLETLPPLPPPQSAVAFAPRPPVPPMRHLETQSSRNFAHFSRHNRRSSECGPSTSIRTVRDSIVIESNETPGMGPGPESRVTVVPDNTTQVSVGGNSPNVGIVIGKSPMTSSPGSGGSGSDSASAEPSKKAMSAKEDLKRKAIEVDDTECHSEGVEFESADGKKKISHGSRSTKRSRAAEVHNLSERRRRDRINEKMKALQELIPGCNKSDKASMLDEAIEYLKALQLQVQMMSMGCNMVPVMFPGVQQYVPMGMGMGMGMGMSMGMGMGMGMSMNRPVVPFPAVPGGAAMQNPAAAVAQIPPRFRVPPPFPMQLPPDTSRIHPTNQTDPSQQYVTLHPAQAPLLPQNQVPAQPNTDNSREVADPENHQSG